MWRLPFSAEAPYYWSYGLLFLLPAGEIKKMFLEIMVKNGSYYSSLEGSYSGAIRLEY
jgi:hypothetical protein